MGAASSLKGLNGLRPESVRQTGGPPPETVAQLGRSRGRGARFLEFPAEGHPSLMRCVSPPVGLLVSYMQ